MSQKNPHPSYYSIKNSPTEIFSNILPPRKQYKPTKRYYLYLILFLGIIIVIDNATKQEEIKQRTGDIIILDPLAGEENGFTDQCIQLYEDAGYRVDTIKGKEVTVDRLKTLPKGYNTVILRVHSGLFENQVWFFTSEPYDNTQHIMEQLSGEVHIGRTNHGDPPVFAVGAPFIKKYLGGRLDDTIILLMGCNGLSSKDLGEAFIECGASTYISWDGPITLEDTDQTTLHLVEYILKGYTPEEATVECQKIVSVEKVYNSQLIYLKYEK